MKSVIVDFRISKKSENTLISKGYSVIRTTRSADLAEPVCGHPDMLLCKLKNHDFVGIPAFRGVFNTDSDLNYIDGKSKLKKEYPSDIAYNCALVGKHLFCNEKYTDAVILEYCKNNSVKIINTKQGYAKCSICIVSDNAIITADKNIYKQPDGFQDLNTKIARIENEAGGLIQGSGVAAGVQNDFTEASRGRAGCREGPADAVGGACDQDGTHQ